MNCIFLLDKNSTNREPFKKEGKESVIADSSIEKIPTNPSQKIKNGTQTPIGWYIFKVYVWYKEKKINIYQCHSLKMNS